MRAFCLTICFYLVVGSFALAGPYSPAAGMPGSTAISKDSPTIREWASSAVSIARGPMDISNPGLGLASFGTPSEALGPSTGSTVNVVSLGDGGSIVLKFDVPIVDGPGPDLAVFENGFGDTFLELAFVEVSANGVDFYRFAATSLTPVGTQVASFGTLDPTNLNNLAGSFRAGFGTPFDLQEIAALVGQAVSYVRVVDVVGSINPLYGSVDSHGVLVNDPWPTGFASGGFDLDAVAALHVVPEPGAAALLTLGLLGLTMLRGRTFTFRK